MRVVFVVLLLVMASPSVAEVVAIRSGQHDSFSRLVLTIPEGRTWMLGRVDGGYALDLGEGEDSFDTSAVFDRVPPNRIAAVSDENGRLKIDLACDCHADAFLWRPDRLVVDVIDGPAPEGSEFEAELDATAEYAEATPLPPAVVLPLIPETVSSIVRAPLLPGTFSVAPPSDDRVSEAERAIVESLARAASQGVFDIPSRVVPILPENLTEEGEPPPPQLPVLTPITDPMDGMPNPLNSEDGSGGPGLVLRTGIERGADGEQGVSEDPGHCISDETLSIDTWGDDRDFSVQIADHRRILTGEFDVIPEGSLESLAKVYLYFGFGQEARQALSIDGNNSQERRILDALSRVVDDTPQRSDVFSDQIDCPGFVVLWAALASGSLEGTSQVGRNAAVMAFRLLPDELRGHLGARLAQLFLDAGDSTTADLLLTAAQRLDGGATVEAELTSAGVIESTEGVGPAIEALDAIAEEDTRMTPDGLVRLIDLMLTDGQVVDDAILELASAMRFEARETEEARALGLAEVRARTARNEFDDALALVFDEDVPFQDADRAEQSANVILALSEREETPAFLTIAFNDLPPGLPAEAENAVAARLLAVGFPERAQSILSGPATGDAMMERRYLRAEAAAALGDLPAMEEALAGMSDDRTTRIRAAALASTGDFENALAENLQTPEAAVDSENAWRAGAWTLLEGGQDPLLQAASRAILTEPTELPSPPTIAARRELLEESQATRALTEELLGRFSLEDQPAEPE